ncbi:hypothetical protein [Desulfopila sp. IMCC35008]|uniref:hypothetical protein n=1 Tax=Desulfopila sp. IMCC35008 TaxID=2653858 RepID=UPI0013D3F14C|nr:hypothetical protein [Desulfopila sp. IMCC35008]
MAKRKRKARPKGELKKELIEQLQLLRNACEAYDNGLEAIGKHISLSLRVLLHHHGQSRSLLEQLGYRKGRFFDSAGPLSPRNLLTECNLVGLRVTGEDGYYLPLISMGGSPKPMKRVKFLKWWNDPVLKDNKKRTFCRRELILHVADTDGGAHVDPELEEAYLAISRENSLGWIFSKNSIESALKGRPELACMRQIAHELLCTLSEYVPELKEHAQPVIPADPETTPGR